MNTYQQELQEALICFEEIVDQDDQHASTGRRGIGLLTRVLEREERRQALKLTATKEDLELYNKIASKILGSGTDSVPTPAVERSRSRTDGMPINSQERRLRRMLCASRHGHLAYMDDGEASFCGDETYSAIDYMREPLDSIQKSWAGKPSTSSVAPEGWRLVPLMPTSEMISVLS